MKLPSIALVIGMVMTSTIHAEIIKGQFKPNGEALEFTFKKGDSLLSLPVRIDDKQKLFLDDKLTTYPNAKFEVDATVSENSVLFNNIPTLVGDIVQKSGYLSIDSDGNLKLSGQKAKLGRTKKIYGNEFDKKSINHYANKNVTVQGHMKDGIFVINSLIEEELLELDSGSKYLPPASFDQDPVDFTLNILPTNSISQSTVPFKGAIYQDEENTVQEGDHFLVITLSGRQGDHPGASAGHFAIGGGQVLPSNKLKAEAYNFYFEGEKEILAGNTDLINYFGHLIQGQQNYRPTYTLFAYGVDKEKLKKVRDLFEFQTHRVRTEKGLKITPNYNCTNTSISAVKHVFFQRDRSESKSLSWINKDFNKSKQFSSFSQLKYALTRSKKQFIPRNAFEYYVKKLTKKSTIKKLGLKRVDLLFIPQTPSNRAIGGTSYNDLGEGKRIRAYTEEWKEKRKTMDLNELQLEVDEVLKTID